MQNSQNSLCLGSLLISTSKRSVGTPVRHAKVLDILYKYLRKYKYKQTAIIRTWADGYVENPQMYLSELY